jgi:hypothetical protein
MMRKLELAEAIMRKHRTRRGGEGRSKLSKFLLSAALFFHLTIEPFADVSERARLSICKVEVTAIMRIVMKAIRKNYTY